MDYKYCKICNYQKISKLPNVSGYNFCPSCHTAWRERVFEKNYSINYYKGKVKLASVLFSPIAHFFYKLREYYIGAQRKNIWVDVGAGDGEFLKTVNATKKIGVEISPSAKKIMKKARIETLSDKDFLKIKNLNADIISFWHVLEHTQKPWEFLKAARNNLSQKGKIIIGVPNIDSLEFKLFGKNWFHLAPEYHIWHFSPASISKLLSSTGFKIEKIDYWSLEHHFSGLIQSFINKTSGNTNFLHKLIKRGLGKNEINFNNIFWTLFWLTLGLPLIFLVFIFQVITKKSGTLVITASRSS